MVNELLAREMSKSQVQYKGEVADLFPVIASPSNSIQLAAYAILATRIPQFQEKASFDAALSKEYTPRLPDELLSLVLEVPSAEDFLDLTHESDIPTSILHYLLSWKLIFTYWTNASYALQSGYVDSLKDGSYLPSLLSLTFDVLIAHRPSHAPFDPSKLDTPIETYTPSPSNDPSTETHRLLTHLYYLSLLHCPSLCKQWWRDACPRALEKKVEPWTEKHISPLVIAAELATVSAWSPNPDDSTALEVRVSSRAREVTASYPIDEQHMVIRIALPPAYPLNPAFVTTVARVGVDEKKWSSWLNTSAIAINFASSSQGLGCVVDGLVAWRRNVSGALKGQSECAICYSVVSADRQLPSKKCGTCKNLFHGSCLFRWFRSSSSSSCPLCRNAFNYA
jgi:E3 ubiquitin-protein ligase listerin